MARANIGMFPSEDMLKLVCECQTARQKLRNIKDVSHRHTLLNRIRARREFNTVEKYQKEKFLSYINRVEHLGSVLKSMGVETDCKDMALEVLNGLQSQYKSLITMLDGLNIMKICSRLNWLKADYCRKSSEKRCVRNPLLGLPWSKPSRLVHVVFFVVHLCARTVIEEALVRQLALTNIRLFVQTKIGLLDSRETNRHSLQKCHQRQIQLTTTCALWRMELWQMLILHATLKGS